ncbi:uncharacterized protein LOC128264036 isoform X4 [Drosophila gunungcola]|uniref:uncharacterized protein LOC128264036 isoform X4 n=1 Tax=Drosophila gunungcola TaxID=103775 RepID=UPI0022E314EB|nr:uncharacterized protein LOC128264036 isoform X4 [Drosophila gunungcola]XP_052855289.1 uncharacterized protein LOC128264036 isoform X4 [Drosophila gunungcola]XP_052855290.1 uncharacterized protein LOC128264036 isoform X4 [Drosophila gunungcola]XP_052855291.1 uncharacterized protein LOC128264036 isoform X4 [Drosophila gunungcola]XP_052855292.1 uncharacterized protein LOC128264036 isoform X4 [Drosophila gunungcola]XP_052855293.1 uncharacterized protein LOC128264036 isoform X4 [Drosophila gunun
MEKSNALQPSKSAGMGSGSNVLHSNSDVIVNLLQQNQQLFERLAINREVLNMKLYEGADAFGIGSGSTERIAQNSNQAVFWQLHRQLQDIYESTIHNKQHLSNTQIIRHLKTLLVGGASNLVRLLAITDTAYSTAWDRLKERYNHPRHIVYSFLEQFLSLPTTTKIDATTLRKVSDGANEIVRGLDEVNQTERDCWIIYLALEKLDADTRRRWIERIMDTDSPTLEEFFKFLDSRCEELELSKRELAAVGKSAMYGEKPRRVTQSMVAVEGNSCTKCNFTGHTLYGCQQFLGPSGVQRREGEIIMLQLFESWTWGQKVQVNIQMQAMQTSSLPSPYTW